MSILFCFQNSYYYFPGLSTGKPAKFICYSPNSPKEFYEAVALYANRTKQPGTFRNYKDPYPLIFVAVNKPDSDNSTDSNNINDRNNSNTEEPQPKRTKQSHLSTSSQSPPFPTIPSSFSLLPRDIIVHILCCIPRQQLLSVALTCKYFSKLVQTKELLYRTVDHEEALSVLFANKGEAYVELNTQDKDSVAALIYTLPMPKRWRF